MRGIQSIRLNILLSHHTQIFAVRRGDLSIELWASGQLSHQPGGMGELPLLLTEEGHRFRYHGPKMLVFCSRSRPPGPSLAYYLADRLSKTPLRLEQVCEHRGTANFEDVWGRMNSDRITHCRALAGQRARHALHPPAGTGVPVTA